MGTALPESMARMIQFAWWKLRAYRITAGALRDISGAQVIRNLHGLGAQGRRVAGEEENIVSCNSKGICGWFSLD